MNHANDDAIKRLSAMALASRLKRLSDRLSRDISRIYREQDVEFEARWFPVAYVLSQYGSLPVTTIAELLGFTHPAVNQIAGQMEKHGLLLSQRDARDERRRLLRLSSKGKQTIKGLRGLWAIIKQSNDDLLTEAGGNLLETIGQVELTLAKKEMYQRVRERILPERNSAVRIVSFAPAMAASFREMNEEWLRKEFRIENIDRAMLNNPQRAIISKGGAIWFALINEKPVGTAAVLRHSDRDFEVAKMAVRPRYQCQGIGTALLNSAITFAREQSSDYLYLSTSTKLKAANRLYRKFGFRRIATPPTWAYRYERETIYMRLRLK